LKVRCVLHPLLAPALQFRTDRRGRLSIRFVCLQSNTLFPCLLIAARVISVLCSLAFLLFRLLFRVKVRSFLTFSFFSKLSPPVKHLCARALCPGRSAEIFFCESGLSLRFSVSWSFPRGPLIFLSFAETLAFTVSCLPILYFSSTPFFFFFS